MAPRRRLRYEHLVSLPNRRQQPRAPLELKVRVDGPKGRQVLTARDLSEGGTFVETLKAYDVGQMLECRLELPQREGAPVRVEVTAEVRHHANGYRTEDGGGPYRGMGLQFTRLDMEARDTLKRFLTERSG